MYIDSAIYFKLLVREPDSFFYARLVEGEKALWSSQILVTEVYSALLRKEREGMVLANHRVKALKQLHQDVEKGALKLVPVDLALLYKANHILNFCYPEIPLRSLDAIHLASFDLIQKEPLVTSDQRMRQAAKKLKLPLHDLPK